MAALLRTKAGGVTVLRFGRWRNTLALSYGTYANGGELHRLSFSPRLGIAAPGIDPQTSAPEAIGSAFGSFDAASELILRGPDGAQAVVTEWLYRSARQLNFLPPAWPRTLITNSICGSAEN